MPLVTSQGTSPPCGHDSPVVNFTSACTISRTTCPTEAFSGISRAACAVTFHCEWLAVFSPGLGLRVCSLKTAEAWPLDSTSSRGGRVFVVPRHDLPGHSVHGCVLPLLPEGKKAEWKAEGSRMAGIIDIDKYEDWKEIATELQHAYSSSLGASNWDCIRDRDIGILKARIGCLVYDPVGSRCAASAAGKASYTKEEQETIERIVSAVLAASSNCKDMLLSFVYICLEAADEDGKKPAVVPFPLIKIPNYDASGELFTFIDCEARVYRSWQNFLHENTLPRLNMCYPMNGTYTVDDDGELLLVFGEAGRVQAAFRTVDSVSSSLQRLSAAVLVPSLFTPVCAPLVACALAVSVAGATYGAVRCGASLVDRYRHKQSVALKSREARSVWLSMLANTGAALSSVSAAALSRLSQKVPVTNSGSRSMKTVGVTNVAAMGVSWLASGLQMVDKEKLTKCDWLELTTSTLLLAYMVIDVRTNMRNLSAYERLQQKELPRKLKMLRVRQLLRKRGGKSFGLKGMRQATLRNFMRLESSTVTKVQSDSYFVKVTVSKTGELKAAPVLKTALSKSFVLKVAEGIERFLKESLEEMAVALRNPSDVSGVNHSVDSFSVKKVVGSNNFYEMKREGESALRNVNSQEKLDELHNILREFCFGQNCGNLALRLAVFLLMSLDWQSSLAYMLRFISSMVDKILSTMADGCDVAYPSCYRERVSSVVDLLSEEDVVDGILQLFCKVVSPSGGSPEQWRPLGDDLQSRVLSFGVYDGKASDGGFH